MLENKPGKIINIASMLSYQGGLKVPAYTASKHSFTDLPKSRRQVNAIASGYMAAANTAPIRENEERKPISLPGSHMDVGDTG